jgi:hypothetical protein
MSGRGDQTDGGLRLAPQDGRWSRLAVGPGDSGRGGGTAADHLHQEDEVGRVERVADNEAPGGAAWGCRTAPLVHQFGGATDDTARQSAIERLGQAHDVGSDAEQLGGAAGRHRQARFHLVVGEICAVLVQQLPQLGEIARWAG